MTFRSRSFDFLPDEPEEARAHRDRTRGRPVGPRGRTASRDGGDQGRRAHRHHRSRRLATVPRTARPRQHIRLLTGLRPKREAKEQQMDTFAYTVNCSILLTDLPLLQRPQAARDAGFDAVELVALRRTGAGGSRGRRVRPCCHGVQLTGLNFAAGDMPAGDRGLLSDPTHTGVPRQHRHHCGYRRTPGDQSIQRPLRKSDRGRGAGEARRDGDRESGAKCGRSARCGGARRAGQRRTGVSAEARSRCRRGDRPGPPITVSSRCDCSPTCITLR